jgi:hypothetical protein
MMKHTDLEKRIAKELGVTPFGLDVILRIHRGDKISGNNSGTMLQRLGLVTEWDTRAGRRRLTPAGEEIYRRARVMGY